MALVLLTGIFVLWVYYPRTVLYPSETFTYPTKQTLGFYSFPMGGGVIAKEEGRFYLHEDRTYKVVFGSKLKLKQIKLLFGADAAGTASTFAFSTFPCFRARPRGTRRKKPNLSSNPSFRAVPPASPLRNRLNLATLSRKKPKPDPFLLQIAPLK